MNAPWNPKTGVGARDAFNAFVCDDETADAVKVVAAELGWAVEKVNKGGLRNAVQTLSVSSSPMVLLVDLSESGDPLNDINALAEVCEPGTIVIAVGMINDVKLYRDLVASGLQDYLLKPLSADAMREAFMHAQVTLQGPKHVEVDTSDRPRSTIAVIGTRGGVGASTVASSLAWLSADSQGRSTALLDLDVQFGTGALSFDLEPGRGLTDALENPSRIDGLFIERAMVRVGDKLAVLSAEAPISQPLIADGSALFQLQEEMRNAFETVVVDLPRTVAVQHPHLLGDVNHVVVVTEQTLASTRDAIRLLGFLKANAPHAKVTMVANRVGTNPPPEVARKDFEASIERKVDIVIPLDVKQAVGAAKQGRALSAVATGKVSGALNALAFQLAGELAAEVEAKTLMSKVRSLLPQKGTAKASGKK
ncbi:AAA family ATPase [Sphingosinicella soli]|uniref:Pilus assembly protein CpaE n=1 Tax=Sphingosinicella soli TaxID=333708 RepID=A0A7W7AZ18_9SPHN|nr:pilus assembly protein CpaE [Sphingosinicella soli]MBB4631000.1 pilus assembly protein CpaE [Sphingosinicella soli]